MVFEYPSSNQISGSTQMTIPIGLSCKNQFVALCVKVNLYSILFVLVCLMEPDSLIRSINVVEEIRNEINKECVTKEIITEEVS